MDKRINLLGRVILTGEIIAKTGMHIGGTPGALAIGGVDSPIIRDGLTGRPYIPGSSLKGKMRSLGEKLTNALQNTTINKGDQNTGKGRVEIHVAKDIDQYNKYWVNPIFGVTGDAGFIPAPTRLVVRDIPLRFEKDDQDNWRAVKTDLPFAEVKWEAAIDRVTSAATPRQIERVPAGAVFSPMELVFSVYLADDVTLFDHLLTCLQLVEDDYLGGHGSRGSGKVEFQNLKIVCKRGDAYQAQDIASEPMLDKLVVAREQIQSTLKQTLGVA